jgi:hypothetical protein
VFPCRILSIHSLTSSDFSFGESKSEAATFLSAKSLALQDLREAIALTLAAILDIRIYGPFLHLIMQSGRSGRSFCVYFVFSWKSAVEPLSAAPFWQPP